ncbi:MAG: S24 family peptidase [Sphingomonadales bacterium]|nr:S24 family peptidase [Sphingomonadales bacterium]
MPEFAALSPGTAARARLVELAAARKVSLASLSALLGRNAAYLQQFVRKGSPRKLEENDRRTLARFFGVAEGELGAPAPAEEAEWAAIPRLAVAASAGPGALAGGEGACGTLRFSTAWLREQGLDPARLSAIVVSGDSMEPALRDGDEILVDTAPAAPASRGIHVVRVEDAVLVKRLEPRAAGRLALVSDNPAYPPRELAADAVTVVGRVVWKGGPV